MVGSRDNREVTSVRDNVLRYVRTPFWAYQSLSPVVRRLVIILVVTAIVIDSLFRATVGGASSITSAIVTTSITLAVGIFVWRPPVATIVLIAAAAVAGAAGVAGSLIAGAAILGLVSYTCSAALTLLYAVSLGGWLLAVLGRPESGFQPLGGLVIALLSLVSLLIGLAIRRQFERAQSLALQLEVSEREVAEQLKHERDLIADELHDIVAHEITIVALHAAVLDRTEDMQTRSQSQTAIREAAVQALTDIRRVLGMVRGEENLSPERVSSPDGITGTIAAVTKELGQAGIAVTADVPSDLRLPSASLVALTRVIRESATNVLKHATGAHTVSIVLRVERGWVHLTFADDSPPARTAGLPASGYGIMRLRERFRLFGGTFESERKPQGWVVSASLPLSG
jgi:signal transduction histidine kinase